MFCEKCGAVLEDNAQFCSSCGTPVKKEEGEHKQQESEPKQEEKEVVHTPEKKKGYGWIIALSIVGGLAALFLLVAIFGNDDEKYIDLVKDGHPEGYPNSTYREAFENFFSNPEWEYFESTEDEDIVEFSGGCTYMDEPVNVVLQFELDYDEGEFTAQYFEMDGEAQSELMTALIIERVFEDYENGDEDSEGILDDLEEEEDNTDLDSEFGEEDDIDMESDAWEEDDYDSDTDYEMEDEENLDEVLDDDADYETEDEDYSDYYIFADSDTRVLSDSELRYCDAETLRLGRNEIYARYGRRFQDEELQQYFDSMPWYVGLIEPDEFDESVLNKYEKKNLKKIVKYENQ